MTNVFDFDELLQMPLFYQPEGTFYEPFFKLEGKLGSLQRFFYVNSKAAQQYLREGQKSFQAKMDTAYAEELDVHGDMIAEDNDYYGGFVYFAIMTQLFSILENHLQEMIALSCEEFSLCSQLSRKGPLIDRYLDWLMRVAGLDFEVSEEDKKRLDTLRRIRNALVHDVARDISSEAIEPAQNLKTELRSEPWRENQRIAFETFELVAELAKRIELAFLSRIEQSPNCSGT